MPGATHPLRTCFSPRVQVHAPVYPLPPGPWRGQNSCFWRWAQLPPPPDAGVFHDLPALVPKQTSAQVSCRWLGVTIRLVMTKKTFSP